MQIHATVPFDRAETTVALMGDVHGSVTWVQRAVPFLRRQGVRTVYQVGDLGYWGPKDAFMGSLEHWLNLGDINLFCTPGNHENWDALDTLFAENPGEPVQVQKHVWMLPRGYRWSHGARSFVSLGGAPSVDFEYRIPGKSWWPTEVMTGADVERTVAGGHAEVMLTHDAPTAGTEKVRRIRVPNPDPQFSWGYEALAYADEGAVLLDRAVATVQPRLLVHGHFHVKDEVTLTSGRHVLSLNKDSSDGNLALLDLTTLETTWLNTHGI